MCAYTTHVRGMPSQAARARVHVLLGGRVDWREKQRKVGVALYLKHNVANAAK